MMILVITAYSWSLWMGGQPMILVITAYSWSLKMGGQTMILVITALFLITSNGCTNLMILVITACLFLITMMILVITAHFWTLHLVSQNTMVKLVPHPGHWDCISLMMFVQPFTHVLWDFSLWVVVAFISFWHVVSFPPWVPASRMCNALGYDFSVWSVMHVHMYCTQRSRVCSKAVATKYDSLVTMVR